MLEFKYDTQLLIEGTNLDEDEINDYITEHFNEEAKLEGLPLNRALRDEDGEIYDIVVEDMDRQSRGLHG